MYIELEAIILVFPILYTTFTLISDNAPLGEEHDSSSRISTSGWGLWVLGLHPRYWVHEFGLKGPKSAYKIVGESGLNIMWAIVSQGVQLQGNNTF